MNGREEGWRDSGPEAGMAARNCRVSVVLKLTNGTRLKFRMTVATVERDPSQLECDFLIENVKAMNGRIIFRMHDAGNVRFNMIVTVRMVRDEMRGQPA